LVQVFEVGEEDIGRSPDGLVGVVEKEDPSIAVVVVEGEGSQIVDV
jgi:hypothetical protein